MSSDRDKHLLRVLRKGAKTDADVFRPGYDLLNYAGSAAQRLLEVMSRGQRGWPGWLRDMARRLNVTEADLAEAAPKFALFMRLIRTGSLNYTIAEAASRSESLQQAAEVNSYDKFKLVFRQVLESLFIERMELNEELFTAYMGKPELQELVSKWLGSQVYDRLSAGKRIRSKTNSPAPTTPPHH